MESAGILAQGFAGAVPPVIAAIYVINRINDQHHAQNSKRLERIERVLSVVYSKLNPGAPNPFEDIDP